MAQPMINLVLEKLGRILDAAEAQAMVESLMREADLTTIDTPEDLLAVCTQLESRAGFIRFIAQSLRAEAIILGGSP